MPTAREIREYNANETLISKLSDELREGVLAGEYRVEPGQNPDKPVVRDVKTGRIVKGSGRSVNANDTREVQRQMTRMKNATYRQALELMMPAFDTPESKLSFEKLLNTMWDAMTGVEVAARCTHPGCERNHLWTPTPDPKTMFKVLELLAGKATETKNVNVNARAEVEILEQRTFDVRVYNMTGELAESRKQQLLDEGIVDASWVEVE